MTEKFAFVTKARAVRFVLAGCLLIGASHEASAQQYGVRAGVSGEPNQFYLGGHVETRPIVDRLTFRPNLEVGFGNELTLVAGNIEFAYKFPLRTSAWSFYGGGGPALVLTNRSGDTDPGGGFNLLFGAQHPRGLFTEIKVGLADSPGFKFGVGYAFRR